jgi:hypothetical protein
MGNGEKKDCFERAINQEGLISIDLAEEVNKLFLSGFNQSGRIYIKIQNANNYYGAIRLTTEDYDGGIENKPHFIFTYRTTTRKRNT